MSDKILRTILLLIIAELALVNICLGQKADSVAKPKSTFSVCIGAGWTHYINTLQITDDKFVKKDYIGGSLRVLWEPGYRISMGVESGFYRVYKVFKEITPDVSGQSILYNVPIFLVARMRVVNNFYISVAPGISVLFSKIRGVGPPIRSVQWSFSNFQADASYLYPLNKHLQVGASANFLTIGKTNDYMYSFFGVLAVKF